MNEFELYGNTDNKNTKYCSLLNEIQLYSIEKYGIVTS